MRILIVDDVYVSRTHLKTLLSAYGDCDAVPNGEAALLLLHDAWATQMPYSLITMDIEMPQMSGQAVLALIREAESQQKIPQDKQAKVVMVTANDRVQDVAQSYQRECSAYIVKPATVQKIQETLKTIGLLGS